MLWKQVMDRFGKKNLWVVGLSAVVMAGVAWIAVPLAKSHRNAAPAQTAFNSSAIDAAGSARVVPSFGPQPLSFEPNLGQTDPQVKFTARRSGYALFLTPAKAVVSLVSPDKTSLRSVKQRPSPSSASTGDVAPPSRRLSLRASRPQPRWRDALGTAGRMPALHQSVLGMEFVGAKDQAEIAGIDLVPGVSNYFIGDDPHRWASGVPHYSRVRYRGIYPGVNLEFRSNGPELGLGFIVEAGADPGLIHLRFTGAKSLNTDANGDLAVAAETGELRFPGCLPTRKSKESCNR